MRVAIDPGSRAGAKHWHRVQKRTDLAANIAGIESGEQIHFFRLLRHLVRALQTNGSGRFY